MPCRYYVLVLAIIVPFFAVANAYGTGLTDFDMSSVYGTVSSLCPSQFWNYGISSSICLVFILISSELRHVESAWSAVQAPLSHSRCLL